LTLDIVWESSPTVVVPEEVWDRTRSGWARWRIAKAVAMGIPGNWQNKSTTKQKGRREAGLLS
jgi:hypothetical protein